MNPVHDVQLSELEHCQRLIMQPIEANFCGGVASSGDREVGIDAAPALPPTLQDALQQILERPDAHTIADLAALTDRLTREMMLFGPLVGGVAMKSVATHGDQAADADCVDARQAALHAEFLRDLEA
jgi:hypothetical protein